MQLNPKDPVEAVVIEAVALSRRKRQDYTVDPDGDPLGNFRSTADDSGLTPAKIVEVNFWQKVARLRALFRSGRRPANESVEDTLLDMLNYLAILVAARRHQAKVEAAAQPTVALKMPLPTPVDPLTATSTTTISTTSTLLPRNAPMGSHVYSPPTEKSA